MATSAKLKSFEELPKDRPFAAAIVKKAAELTPRYRVIVQWDDQTQGYAGSCLELPNAVGFGDTESECIAEVRGNIDALVSHLLETGQTLADAAGQSLPDYLSSAALRGN